MVSFFNKRLSWSDPCKIGLVVVLAGCGGAGGGDGGSTFANGVFLDSPVEGLRYQVGGLVDFTDEEGGFQYLPGRSISFYVGDIFLGSTTGDDVLTPVDLVAGTSLVSNPSVTNRIRFLQTLDDDYDSSNGIRISEEVRLALMGVSQSFTFEQSIQSFQFDQEVVALIADATGAIGSPRMLIPEFTAQAHMRATIEDIEFPDRTVPDTYGSLDIINAPQQLGSSFEPIPRHSFSTSIPGFRMLEWNQPLPGLPGSEAAVRLEMGFSPNSITGNPVIAQISLTWASQAQVRLSYGVSCNNDGNSIFPHGNGCNNIGIDLVAGEITFDSLELRSAGSDNTLVLDGELGIP